MVLFIVSADPSFIGYMCFRSFNILCSLELDRQSAMNVITSSGMFVAFDYTSAVGWEEGPTLNYLLPNHLMGYSIKITFRSISTR